jgi:triacylglycerol lipase
MKHLILLVPGFFGFAKLGGIRYFRHVEKVLQLRFQDAGHELRIFPVSTLPTGSIRKRARLLADALMSAHPTRAERIHIIGHSTGGLDARLLATPGVSLGNRVDRFRHRIESVVTLSTPHYGTPIAAFFTNVAGKHLLFAVSLLMVVSMHGVGGRSYAWLGRLLAFVSQWDDLLGLDNTLLDYLTRKLLAEFDQNSREEVIGWASSITSDQGALLQLTPEGMDIFNAAAVNDPEVTYLSYVTAVPPPSVKILLAGTRDPYFPASYAMFSALHRVASGETAEYPYPPFPEALREMGCGVWNVSNLERLADGLVPARSQVWGQVGGLVQGDHLDVCGHFYPGKGNKSHTDWLRSGARFTEEVFQALWGDIAARLLEARIPSSESPGFVSVGGQ